MRWFGIKESVLVCSLIAFGQSAHAADYVSVQAEPVMQGGQSVLEFTIKNTSTSTLHLSGGNLPWAFPAPVVIVAAWRWGDILEHAPPPPPTHATVPFVDIKPGETLRGTVAINRYVVGLEKARKKGDVVLFWWYDCWDNSHKLGEFGGWFKLPKAS